MLLLDEESCKKLSAEKQVLCVLQWLQSLPQTIRNTSKVGTWWRNCDVNVCVLIVWCTVPSPRAQEELKRAQKQLVAQLQSRLYASLGPPLRSCLGQAFVSLYAVGDTFSLSDTLGKCCDIVKAKEDAAAGPSNNKL